MSTSVPLAAGVRHTLRALGHRNYRLFFFGQGVSLIGTWMQMTALGWLIYEVAHSKRLLGEVAFAGQIPMLFLAPLAGVLADRWDGRRLLVGLQALAMLQAAALAALVLGGFIERREDCWLIMALAAVMGTINAFEMPTRQSFVVRMVGDRADLPNAIALNSLLMNGSRLIGPAVAGWLIARVNSWTAEGGAASHAGAGACFLINALSYAGVIVALLYIRPAPRESAAGRRHPLHELHEGLLYAWRTPAIRLLLAFLAGLSLVGFPYAVLLPAFAKEVLGGDAWTLGRLMSATGVGAVIGTVLLAARPSPLGLGRLMAVAAGLFGAALVAFSFSRSTWLSMLILVVAGFGLVSMVVSSNTLLQTLVDDDKRGRVMGLHAVAFLGMAPFGSLLAGWVAERIGAPNTVLACGIACGLGAAAFATRLPALSRSLASARPAAPTVAPPV